MLPFNITYKEALAKADHLVALGETNVWLHGDDCPWDKVTDIEGGSARRFNSPTGFRVIVEEAGLRLGWSIDFEDRDANGRSVSLFEPERLRDIAGRLPAVAKVKFGQFLTDEVLPDLYKRTEEIRTALHQQEASENCVRGLIAFCNAQ